jgi:hypothetical protein
MPLKEEDVNAPSSVETSISGGDLTSIRIKEIDGSENDLTPSLLFLLMMVCKSFQSMILGKEA